MPGASTAFFESKDSTGDATGARTARDATDVIGTFQTSSITTFNANTLAQAWGHRRFVSHPLAAHTFAIADGNWTFSFAGSESNTNHSGSFKLYAYVWRPSTGLAVDTNRAGAFAGISATSETALTASVAWNGTTTALDGDILVFEISDTTTQSMSSAYNSTFFYDGTTEANTTSCASLPVRAPARRSVSGQTTLPAPGRGWRACGGAPGRVRLAREAGVEHP